MTLYILWVFDELTSSAKELLRILAYTVPLLGKNICFDVCTWRESSDCRRSPKIMQWVSCFQNRVSYYRQSLFKNFKFKISWVKEGGRRKCGPYTTGCRAWKHNRTPGAACRRVMRQGLCKCSAWWWQVRVGFPSQWSVQNWYFRSILILAANSLVSCTIGGQGDVADSLGSHSEIGFSLFTDNSWVPSHEDVRHTWPSKHDEIVFSNEINTIYLL